MSIPSNQPHNASELAAHIDHLRKQAGPNNWYSDIVQGKQVTFKGYKTWLQVLTIEQVRVQTY